ncbi:terminase [Mesorhizobium sp. NBSH29]|nr:terminase [Mesorhizobium sp. NBSH29]
MPGPRKPELTPYTIAFSRAVHGRTHKRVVQVLSAQSGKSEALLDIIGSRLDQAPVPLLYVGPTQQMVREQFEPRVMALLDEAPSLMRKVSRGKKMSKTRKFISGVPLRLAHAGSSAALKSDPFGLAITDEADELVKDVKKAGNPIELIDLRGDTYADFVHAIVSTPGKGPSEVAVDEESGLEFWADVDQEEVESAIWRLWLSGTRYHWAWPCPHCNEYFIPRFKCLAWDKEIDPHTGKELPSTASMARRTAHLVCPRNGCVIEDDDKADMNAKGVYVSPGQTVNNAGIVQGSPPESWTLSYWASGLASPFKTWGDRAAKYVEAVRTRDHATIQTVMNGDFGELYAPGDGDVPEWQEVARLRDVLDEPYRLGEVPDGVKVLVMTVDVQKSRLIYTIRGWGAEATSWLVDAGELHGETDGKAIWDDLANLMSSTYDGVPIKLTLIDSGFRPGKKEVVPQHRVYEFCRRFPHTTRATKGTSTAMRKPVIVSKIDVKIDGKEFKKGLDLLRLDVDYFKSLVHQKVKWPEGAAGGWYLPTDLSDDYCMQIVSEARVKTPSGAVRWVQRAKENHFLDTEAMQLAAAMILNLRAIRSAIPQAPTRASRPDPAERYRPLDREPETDQPVQRRKKRREGYLKRESIW